MTRMGQTSADRDFTAEGAEGRKGGIHHGDTLRTEFLVERGEASGKRIRYVLSPPYPQAAQTPILSQLLGALGVLAVQRSPSAPKVSKREASDALVVYPPLHA